MTLAEKLERSKHGDNIDFSAISCKGLNDPLVAIQPSDKIMIDPVWLLTSSLEGALYSKYIQEHPGYAGVYVRAGLLPRLQRAAKALPDNISLVVRTGHRPSGVQKQLLRAVMKDYQQNNPTATHEQALADARIYVSDPAIKLPPHCCAAAVDVELYDSTTQQLLDFGSRLNTNTKTSYLHSAEITAEQQQNRMLLLHTMLAANFASYYAEWWHYSYGDQMWAWFYGHKNSLYGLIQV